MFNPAASSVVQDWITPSHVELVKVNTHADQLDWITRRARELREQMGPRYLCHEKNRVSRLDGRVYSARKAPDTNIRSIKRKAA